MTEHTAPPTQGRAPEVDRGAEAETLGGGRTVATTLPRPADVGSVDGGNSIAIGLLQKCPKCKKPSRYNPDEDLFFHVDGSDNEACWLAFHEQGQAKSTRITGRNEENLVGWLNSGGGRTPADDAIARRDAEDRARYGDRVDNPSPYANEQTTFRDTLRDALVDSGGLDSIPEPEPLVDGTLYHDSLAWIQGKRSNGKSFVALDIAGCVGTGHHWHGRAVTQGGVLFIAAEGVSGVRWRVRAWEKSYDRGMDNVQFLPMPVQANLDQWYHLVDLAHDEYDFDLIVLDTQARMTVGMEENAAKDMGEFVDRLELLRKATGACVLVVHHMGRNGEHMRGSTALEGAATTILQVAKDDDEVTVTCEKQKDAEEFDDIHLRLVPVADSAVLMPSDDSIVSQNTSALKMAAKWWGCSRATVSPQPN